MNELHLFSGAGGGILGGMLLGHTTVCAVEIDPYCRKVLLQRQRDGILPRFPVWDDIRTFDGTPWRDRVDVVCGGFPCQDISAAGRGAGIKGERSGLWSEMARVVSEVRPKYVFVENSPLLVRRGLAVVLGDLAEMGYDARWGVVGGQHAHAPAKRERLWVVAWAVRFGCNGREEKRHNISAGKVYQGEPNNRIGVWGEVDGRMDLDDWRKIASKFCRLDDGLAGRLDKLRAIGNGQVPAVAALAWRILSSE